MPLCLRALSSCNNVQCRLHSHHEHRLIGPDRQSRRGPVGGRLASRRFASNVRAATLPRADDHVHDVLNTYAVLDLCEDRRSTLPTMRDPLVPSKCIALEPQREGNTYRIFLASLSMTSRSAPMSSARSVLFTISRSLCVIPGPPLRGTLSPPATSIT